MRMSDSWGIQYDTVKELRTLGCSEVRILETEENIVYSIPFDVFFRESRVEDYGDGMQAFCPRSLFTLTAYEKNNIQPTSTKGGDTADTKQ